MFTYTGSSYFGSRLQAHSVVLFPVSRPWQCRRAMPWAKSSRIGFGQFSKPSIWARQTLRYEGPNNDTYPTYLGHLWMYLDISEYMRVCRNT